MKSRDLSITEFLQVLQLEYFSFKTRELIYERPEFIKMNRDIAEKKKEKIINLAKKFHMISIFDSKKAFQRFFTQCFSQEYGMPNFQYGTNQEKNISISYWDKFYLFHAGNMVSYKKEIYKIKTNIPDEDSIILNVKGEDITLPYVYVTNLKLVAIFAKEMIDK